MPHWTPPILEEKPTPERNRLLGLSAISAVLVGGVMAMNTILTGGWQWGEASAATHPVYYDDVEQQWSQPAPSVPVAQPVVLADARDASAASVAPVSAQLTNAQLEGAAPPVSPAVFTQPAAPSAPVDDDASRQRFDQLEAQVQEAIPSQSSVATSDDDARTHKS